MVEPRDTPWWLPVKRPIALWGRIFIPPGLRERLVGEDPEALADVVDHESIHVARQHARGMWSWHLRYALSRSFRWNEEKAAYWSSLRRAKGRGRPPSSEERERLIGALAGWPYVFMTDRESARRFVEAALGDA